MVLIKAAAALAAAHDRAADALEGARKGDKSQKLTVFSILKKAPRAPAGAQRVLCAVRFEAQL